MYNYTYLSFDLNPVQNADKIPRCLFAHDFLYQMKIGHCVRGGEKAIVLGVYYSIVF